MPVRYWKHSKVRTAHAPFLLAASHPPLPGELISTPWPWKARAQALQSPLVKLQNCKLLSTLTDTQTHQRRYCRSPRRSLQRRQDNETMVSQIQLDPNTVPRPQPNKTCVFVWTLRRESENDREYINSLPTKSSPAKYRYKQRPTPTRSKVCRFILSPEDGPCRTKPYTLHSAESPSLRTV